MKKTILEEIIEKNHDENLKIIDYYKSLYEKDNLNDKKSYQQNKNDWFYSKYYRRKPINVLEKISQDFFLICECKKASPSKGIIRNNYDSLQLAKDYQEAGADAISILTEKYFFKGDINHLSEIRQQVNLPLLRKDFIVEEEQVFEAYQRGADIVLLIVSCLNVSRLKALQNCIQKLGMTALVEIHNEKELKVALEIESQLIGINNRNLNTFETSIDVCLNLKEKIPKNIFVIAESGLKDEKDIQLLKQKKFNGALIGESILVQEDTQKAIKKLR